MIKLSVIIPVYNTPQHLLEYCLSRIQENLLSLKDTVEVLLINDGSTEPYIESTLKKASEADSRIKYVYKANSGVSATRNMGLEMAQGEYITCVDSDDYLMPDALKYMLGILEKHSPEIAILGCYNECMPKSPSETFQKELSKSEIASHIKMMCSSDEEEYWDKGIFLDYPHAICYSTSFLRRHGISYNPRLVIGEDLVFNLSCMARAKNVYVDNTCVYHYVLNQDSVMRKPSPVYMNNLPSFLGAIEEVAHHPLLSKEEIAHAISRKCLRGLQIIRQIYLTHPSNDKSFWELKSELTALLSNPTIRKYVNNLRLKDAKDKVELKNIILLKLRLYWIFLITERRKRLKNAPHSN